MYYQESFNPNDVIEYLRKSRSDDPLLSVEEVLERHEKILNEYSEKCFGALVPEENVYREIASSETIDDRPEMCRLLKAVESPKIKAVLVVEVQRLSRGDLEDAGRLIKLLRYTNTKIITPQKTYDLQDEYDRDAFERELKRGNEYLEYFKRIQARGRLASVKSGNFVGSIPPYGYDKTFITDGKKKYPTLSENKEQADVVRMVFDMYVNLDMGCTNICNRLNELNITPPKGKYWSPASIYTMLDNIHYIGKVRWNWRKTVTIVEEQEIIKTRPHAKVDEDYYIFDGKHKGIITESLFAAAQEKRGRNHRAKASTKIRNPFASILYCRCGKAMSLKITKSKGKAEKTEYRLICDGQTHCETGSVAYEELFDRICETLKLYIKDFEVRLQNKDDNSAELHSSLIRNLENKLHALEEKEISQWEKYSEEGMPKHIFEQLNQKVLQEKEDTRQALAKAYESIPQPIDYQECVSRFSDALTTLQDPDISAESKNKYLKSVFTRINYYRPKPVRINNKDANLDNATPTGVNWYSYPFELDIDIKL